MPPDAIHRWPRPLRPTGVFRAPRLGLAGQPTGLVRGLERPRQLRQGLTRLAGNKSRGFATCGKLECRGHRFSYNARAARDGSVWNRQCGRLAYASHRTHRSGFCGAWCTTRSTQDGLALINVIATDATGMPLNNSNSEQVHDRFFLSMGPGVGFAGCPMLGF